MDGAEQPREHYSVDEFRSALDLSDADWARLYLIARNQCRRAPGLCGPNDVMHTAIERGLSGKRKWPKGEKLSAFLAGVMRSVVSDAAKKAKARKTDLDPDAGVLDAAPDANMVSQMSLAAIVGRMNEVFADDEECALLFEGRLEGMEKSELLELFDGDETRYGTVCKRFRRKMNQHENEFRGMIDGR